MSEIQFLTTGPMYKRKLDNKGQGSAELILIIGGLLVIVLFVGSYMSNITQKTQENIHNLLKIERDNLINKI
ncbi:class III signal peptide-containing protein [uncultured Methanobrevibacter sp.]|uniref:class III signal peptide-containing protein n=1 Tax=uncultured Methanobrevibacter sp. TaxID=253161 RepID=UPI0034586730